MMTPNRSFRRAAARGAIAALAATTLLASCGDDDEDASSSDTTASDTTVAETTEAPSGEITIEGAWGRTSPAMATAGAVYMEITNGTDAEDALVGAAVDPSVAATVELHETVAAGEGEMGDGDMSATTMGDEMSTTTAMMTDDTGMGGDTTMPGTGMMEMRPVEEISLPAGETVALEPGGLHIMLLDLVEPLTVGTTIDVTLTFEYAGEQTVTVEILDAAP